MYLIGVKQNNYKALKIFVKLPLICEKLANVNDS